MTDASALLHPVTYDAAVFAVSYTSASDAVISDAAVWCRCKVQEAREESCAFFNSPELGWAIKNLYMTEWSHSALWKQVPFHQKPDWQDLYEEGLGVPLAVC